jgi:hypothetical protein
MVVFRPSLLGEITAGFAKGLAPDLGSDVVLTGARPSRSLVKRPRSHQTSSFSHAEAEDIPEQSL